ncbi:MAG: 50S ribosome-binding protein YggL [Planctomycetota bacterium]
MSPHWGVEFACALVGQSEELPFLDEFIEFVEANAWRYGGGCSAESLTGVVQFENSDRQRGEQHADRLRDWLSAAPTVQRVDLLRLIDVTGDPDA